MTSAFGYSLVAYIHYFIAVSYCRKSVSNYEACSALKQMIDASLQISFGLGVDGRGGFVKHQYLRIGKNGTRKGNKLLLPL